MKNKLQCIFFDATETLFRVRDSVGVIYARVAARHGIQLNPHAINTSFLKSLKNAPPLCFPNVPESAIKNEEINWWRNRVRETLGVHASENLFLDLYETFSQRESWELFPDALPTLTILHEKKIHLGVISNFDSRLHQILAKLELNHFFKQVICSGESGFAKPDQRIFRKAIPNQMEIQKTGYVGNDVEKDIRPACTLGMKTFLIDRHHNTNQKNLDSLPCELISDLQQILDHI